MGRVMGLYKETFKPKIILEGTSKFKFRLKIYALVLALMQTIFPLELTGKAE